MGLEDVEYIEISGKKCYICGRSEKDLESINKKIFRKYDGDLKDYYYENLRIRLEERELARPVLCHDESNIYISWSKEDHSEELNLSEKLFHPNETTDQWVQLGLKFGILKIIFNKIGDKIMPEIELTGEKPTDEQMEEFKKVDKQHWLLYGNMDYEREKLKSELENYCKQSKDNTQDNSFEYLRGGIIKQLTVRLKVHICTICSLVQLPGHTI